MVKGNWGNLVLSIIYGWESKMCAEVLQEEGELYRLKTVGAEHKSVNERLENNDNEHHVLW